MTSAIAGTGSSSQVRVWAPPLRVFSTPSRPLRFRKWDPYQWDRPCVVADGPHRGDRPLRTGNTGRLENRAQTQYTRFKIGPTPEPTAELGYCGKSKASGPLEWTRDSPKCPREGLSLTGIWSSLVGVLTHGEPEIASCPVLSSPKAACDHRPQPRMLTGCFSKWNSMSLAPQCCPEPLLQP